MICKTFNDQWIHLDHGIRINQYRQDGLIRTRWEVDDGDGISQFPMILIDTEDGYIELYWDHPQYISREQKNRLRQLVEDFPSIGRLNMPHGERPKIFSNEIPDIDGEKTIWIHSARQETPHGPCIQWYIYDPWNDRVSAKFRVLWDQK